MKKNIITKGLASVLIASSMASVTSCSSDYLDLKPITGVTDGLIAETIEGARGAMVGLCFLMYHQQSDLQGSYTNGEPFICSMYGDANSSYYQSYFWYKRSTDGSYINMGGMQKNNAWYAVDMWEYCYCLIGTANKILAVIDGLDSYNGERDFIKAVALTIRAHAYTHLLQVYAPRWADSNNGNTYCIVLRDSDSTEDKDVCMMNDVFDLIYSDCTEAINLFETCNFSRTAIWQPNGPVAHGVFARAALLKNDYSTALAQAQAARSTFNGSIMSQTEYKNGFIEANDEYMWATMFQSEGIYYWAFGTTHGVNGRYTNTWYCSDGMDYDLYRTIPDTDVRKGMYLTPEMVEMNSDIAEMYGLTTDDFFNSTLTLNDSWGIIVNRNNQAMKDFLLDYGGFYDTNNGAIPPRYGYGRGVPNYTFSSGTTAAYINQETGNVVFGAQFKFWGDQVYGTDQFPYMRLSEMGYIVAECQYMLGNTSAAQQTMNELNQGVRDDNYTCTATGADLLQEIKNYRLVELWGEGFSWFDQKRWGEDRVRHEWEAGNPDSGSWAPLAAITIPASAYWSWRPYLPAREVNYNKAIDLKKIPNGMGVQ